MVSLTFVVPPIIPPIFHRTTQGPANICLWDLLSASFSCCLKSLWSPWHISKGQSILKQRHLLIFVHIIIIRNSQRLGKNYTRLFNDLMDHILCLIIKTKAGIVRMACIFNLPWIQIDFSPLFNKTLGKVINNFHKTWYINETWH